MDRHAIDDAERLRQDDADWLDLAGMETADAVPGASAVAVRTVSGGSYPTTAQRFYKCEVYRVTGAEVEGGTATETATGKYIFAWNRGSAIPAVGTRLVAVWAPYRWQFTYNG